MWTYLTGARDPFMAAARSFGEELTNAVTPPIEAAQADGAVGTALSKMRVLDLAWRRIRTLICHRILLGQQPRPAPPPNWMSGSSLRVTDLGQMTRNASARRSCRLGSVEFSVDGPIACR